MEWIFLIIAIVSELIATTLMKYSNGFTKLLPTIGTCLGYIVSFSLLSQSLKKIDVSVAYAVWSGGGIIVMTIIGVLMFQESINIMKVVSMLLIVIGVIGLNLSGVSH